MDVVNLHCSTNPKEPEDVVLILPNDGGVCVARNGVTKQPESQRASKDVNVFLERWGNKTTNFTSESGGESYVGKIEGELECTYPNE